MVGGFRENYYENTTRVHYWKRICCWKVHNILSFKTSRSKRKHDYVNINQNQLKPIKVSRIKVELFIRLLCSDPFFKVLTKKKKLKKQEAYDSTPTYDIVETSNKSHRIVVGFFFFPNKSVFDFFPNTPSSCAPSVLRTAFSWKIQYCLITTFRIRGSSRGCRARSATDRLFTRARAPKKQDENDTCSCRHRYVSEHRSTTRHGPVATVDTRYWNTIHNTPVRVYKI